MEYFPKMCDVREANKHIKGDSPRHDVTDTLTRQTEGGLVSEAHAGSLMVLRCLYMEHVGNKLDFILR